MPYRHVALSPLCLGRSRGDLKKVNSDTLQGVCATPSSMQYIVYQCYESYDGPGRIWQVTQRKDVRLYYGTHSPEHAAFQERIPAWESQGIKVVPVFSENSGAYVQDVYAKVRA